MGEYRMAPSAFSRFHGICSTQAVKVEDNKERGGQRLLLIARNLVAYKFRWRPVTFPVSLNVLHPH